jgi:signal transduction histidine kinase
MLYNLLSNAIGFSDTGGRIALRCRRQESMLAFTVDDQGVGIPEDYQQAVFDRFESRSHGSRHRGAGLGLSVVKGLAELHGGTVALESAPGRGTRVTLLLPYQEPAGESSATDAPHYKSSRAG